MTLTVRSPRQVIFAEGAAGSISTLAGQLGRRCLVVTDRALLQQPSIQKVIASVERAGPSVEVFADVTPEVPLGDIEAATEELARLKADVVVAIGGGSTMDLAKLAGTVHRHGGQVSDFYGECAVPGPITPVIAVPTTAGTGSEVSPVAVLSDPTRDLKVGVSSVYLVPEFAVVDPLLTLSCPAHVTAHTGLDALCHAVEAYTSRPRRHGWREAIHSVFVGRNAVADEFALRAVRGIAQNLERAVVDGSDVRARSGMSLAATQAGMALAHAGTGCPHALQYPLGSLTGTPHGLGVGLLLPYVLRSILDEATERLAVLAACVSLPEARSSPSEAAEAFVQWVSELAARVDNPTTNRP